MSSALTTGHLFDCSHLLHKDQFENISPFLRLGSSLGQWLQGFLSDLGVADIPVIHGEVSPHSFISGRVYIAKGAKVEPTAMISGPCYIGPGTEVRHGAYIRGTVYVGKDCVVGHTTEVKGSVFLDGAKAGHFAYVGDSILGRNVNLGAGTKLANLKFAGHEIQYFCPIKQEKQSSGLRKLGALIGDECHTGCNSVLDPGCIMMPGTIVMPAMHFRGTLERGIARNSK